MFENAKLIYGYDPLCGWCYAFASEMEAVHAALPALQIDVLFGGLVVGERVGPIADNQAYLLNGETQLIARTNTRFGIPFKTGLLSEGTYMADSEPPCRAVWSVQQIAPEKGFAFANALPTAHYWEGKALDDAEVLASIAGKMGIDADQFLDCYLSPAAKKGVQTAFADARAGGLVSYPTLWAEVNGERHLFLKGWQPAANIIQQLTPVLGLS